MSYSAIRKILFGPSPSWKSMPIPIVTGDQLFPLCHYNWQHVRDFKSATEQCFAIPLSCVHGVTQTLSCFHTNIESSWHIFSNGTNSPRRLYFVELSSRSFRFEQWNWRITSCITRVIYKSPAGSDFAERLIDLYCYELGYYSDCFARKSTVLGQKPCFFKGF